MVHTLRLLPRRIDQLTAEAGDLHQRMNAVITAHAPALLERPGVGPDNAAALVVAAGDNPDRLASDGGHHATLPACREPRYAGPRRPIPYLPVLDELVSNARHVTEQYANNRVEAGCRWLGWCGGRMRWW